MGMAGDSTRLNESAVPLLSYMYRRTGRNTQSLIDCGHVPEGCRVRVATCTAPRRATIYVFTAPQLSQDPSLSTYQNGCTSKTRLMTVDNVSKTMYSHFT